MTCHEAIKIIPYTTKVRVKETGGIFIVRLKHERDDGTMLLKLDDGIWYTNEEVELV